MNIHQWKFNCRYNPTKKDLLPSLHSTASVRLSSLQQFCDCFHSNAIREIKGAAMGLMDSATSIKLLEQSNFKITYNWGTLIFEGLFPQAYIKLSTPSPLGAPNLCLYVINKNCRGQAAWCTHNKLCNTSLHNTAVTKFWNTELGSWQGTQSSDTSRSRIYWRIWWRLI